MGVEADKVLISVSTLDPPEVAATPPRPYGILMLRRNGRRLAQGRSGEPTVSRGPGPSETLTDRP